MRTEVDEHRAGHQEEEARRQQPDVGPLLEDVRAPGLADDRAPRATAAFLRRHPWADPQHDGCHRDQLDDRDRGDRQLDSSPAATASVTARNPVTLPRICIRPTIALAMPDLPRRWTRSGTYPWNGPRAMFVLKARSATNTPSIEDGVRRRDPEQEHEVEQRADDDVRLAPAPAADRVVADRSDRGLDEDRRRSPSGSRAGRGFGRPRAPGRPCRRSSGGSG